MRYTNRCLPLPLPLRTVAYITACTTVQAVTGTKTLCYVMLCYMITFLHEIVYYDLFVSVTVSMISEKFTDIGL